MYRRLKTRHASHDVMVFQRNVRLPSCKGRIPFNGTHKSEVMLQHEAKGVCRQIFIISTKSQSSDGLFAYFFYNFHMISHISVVARKWIIIIQAKYLMFPLFERANKQMRHQQFIARTITQRLFPTVRPGLAWQPRLALSASELCWDGASSGFRPPLH